MPKCDVINQSGKVVGEKELPDGVFGVDFNGGLVHQVVVCARACRQMGTSSTKTRTTVSGTGKKPFRQKGTGWARQGTLRGPHMRGGGVAFGPQPHRRIRKVTKKMRRGAIRSMLSQRRAEGRLRILDSLEIPSGKTRDLNVMLEGLGLMGQEVVLIQKERDAGLFQASQNLVGARVAQADRLSATLLLDSDVLLATPDAIDRIVEVYAT
jgi:large subunit ribosomal protein L4